MSRYFLEVAYKGTRYSGFQVQENANTVQAEVEKAFAVLQREAVVLTGSSRTDAGVHALQNYFHFDFEGALHEQFVYKMNAILPADVVIRGIRKMSDSSHCRFDAVSRGYAYHIYRSKDPFVADRAYFFPYRLDMGLMREAAELLRGYEDFSAFSKRNTQAKSFRCRLVQSEWEEREGLLVYNVRGNRFLRGMVRALTATMLRVGRGKIGLGELAEIVESGDCTRASFAVPGHGLTLISVEYPEGYFGLEK